MKKLSVVLTALLILCASVFGAIDTSSFTKIEDFNGLPIGVQTAVLYEELIQDRVPDTEFQYYTMPTDMILALKSGKVAAYLVEAVGYGVHKANHPELDTFVEIPGYISASNIIGNNDKQERILREMNEFIENGYKNGLLGDNGSLYQYWIADFDPLTDNVGVKDFTFTGENGTLNVAVEGGYEPFSFVSDGNLAGFDVEFVCRFCVEYGYKPVFHEVPFESIAPGVETGKFDIGMNIVVSEERNETGTLSEIYYTCPVLLVVLGSEDTAAAASTSDVSKFNTIEDFNGLPIGVQTAVLYEELIQDRVPDTEFQYYTMPTDMILALKSGKVAGYLVEGVGYGVHKANHPELDTFKEIPGYISASNIIGNNDRQEVLLAQMNEFIDNGYKNGLLGDEGSLYQYWIADFDPLTDNVGVKDFTFTGENGTLNVAVEGGYEPFSFVSDGNLAGFDVEFICRFCVEYGYKPVFHEVPFESIAPGVETGKFDIGMNIVVSEERNETGTLSDIYYTCPVYLVIMGSESGSATGTGTVAKAGFFEKIQTSFYKTFIRENRWKLFVSGAGVTTLITICSIIIGTVLGFAVYMACRHGNKIANRITNFFMWLIHGMPTVLLLMILYYIIFGASRLPGMWISVVGFSLMFAASMIDMLRVGYNAIGRGQYEASTALGYSDGQSFFKILLPQAAHHFLPIYSNEVVTLIKETSVVGYIAVLDLTKISDLVRSRTYEAFFALILTAVVYFLIQALMVKVVRIIQKKIDPRRRSDKKILAGIDASEWELF